MIDQLCSECSSLIENHEKIQLLSAVHYNLGKTLQACPLKTLFVIPITYLFVSATFNMLSTVQYDLGKTLLPSLCALSLSPTCYLNTLSTAQYSTAQYSTAQQGTAQHSRARARLYRHAHLNPRHTPHNPSLYPDKPSLLPGTCSLCSSVTSLIRPQL